MIRGVVSMSTVRLQFVLMKIGLLLVLAVTLAGSLTRVCAQPDDLARIWVDGHVSRMNPSQVKHADLKGYLRELEALGVRVSPVGKSLAGREISQLEFGRGPFRVLLWSQMHGDEPTATSALIDLFAYLQRNRATPWVRDLEQRVTLHAVPMLNPDGAELFQRRNLQSIDINRDARLLSTPEGQLLRKLRDEWAPHLGFNLHNQNTRTAVGSTGRQATISLLAVPYDQFGNDNERRILAKKVCAVIVEALSPFIYGQLARYDDSFNPRAFGDYISQAGTPVVLIETGGWEGRSEMDLVQLNFIALASVMQKLSDGSIEKANPAVYDALRYNETGEIYDLIIRNATLVSRGLKDIDKPITYRADLGVNIDRSGLGGKRTARAQIADVGDLTIFTGLETADGGGYFVAVASGAVRTGAEANLLFYSDSRAKNIDWGVPDLETRYPPDAIFRDGKWSGNSIPPRK
jgi:hypothetical protein